MPGSIVQDRKKRLVAESIVQVIQAVFPGKAASLCHVHAIVGANLAGVAFAREYRPVAGWAVIDTGAGHLVKLIDNNAFSSGVGGAYHCWIESVEQRPDSREAIDFSVRHNKEYVVNHRMAWNKASSPDYIWGLHRDVVLDGDLETLPARLPDDKIWVRESEEGKQWMAYHVAAHVNEYVKLTTLGLKILQIQLEELHADLPQQADAHP